MTGGIYVHFPYCEHRCTYCDFVVATPRRIPQKEFTEAILAEVEQRASAFDSAALTLYLGGGTPSLWELGQLKRVIDAIKVRPGLVDGAEVTIEANPNEINAAHLSKMRQVGINRISLGVQSFQDKFLKSVERMHDGAQADKACQLINASEFETYSFDLIFGLPGQRLEEWLEDLRHAIDIRPPHLSVYGLTVEPNTLMHHQVRTKRIVVPDEGEQADMMFSARELLIEAGYTHYEVSSYALPGHRAEHNSSYWQGVPYLGIGPGAHGFLPPRRWVNSKAPQSYITSALKGAVETKWEDVSASDLLFERLMTGLRDLEHGLVIEPFWDRYAIPLKRQADLGNLSLEQGRIRLTEQGVRLMNSVLLDLI